MTRPSPLPVALLTDFGLGDWFVGAMKGEILRRAPQTPILDLTHGVPAGSIEAGAFALAAALGSLPCPAVLCCVVDPGVGSARRAICGRIGRWLYSGPDNGLATPLLEPAGTDFELFEITQPDWRNPHLSRTFHGRDLFAPAAARLALGRPPQEAGPPVTDPVRLVVPPPRRDGALIVARIVWVDHFGNLITNLPRELTGDDSLMIEAGPWRLDGVSATFADVPPGQPLACWGSAGTLELAICLGSAAAATGLKLGDPVRVRIVQADDNSATSN